MGTRRKARECALQMLFAADVAKAQASVLTNNYWNELGEDTLDEKTRGFADAIVVGALRQLDTIDDTIRTRAEHWRIERMAIVDRNVLRLAVYEFLFTDTPHTVVINEALEIARRFRATKRRSLSTAFSTRSNTISKKCRSSEKKKASTNS